MSGDIWPLQPVAEHIKGPLGTLKQGSWINPVPNPGTQVKTTNPTPFLFLPGGASTTILEARSNQESLPMTQAPSERSHNLDRSFRIFI